MNDVSKHPWLEKWEVKGDLGVGGQGLTKNVTSRESGTEAVLKILKKQDDFQARARMAEEVISLKRLVQLDCAVPTVIEDNTSQFAEEDVALYFVMDKISGDTVNSFIAANGPLSLPDTIKLVQNLSKHVAIGNDSSILHRDLKPQNVMVTNSDTLDIVILDYGLSFNLESDGNLTRPSETLDNEFLSLPERRVPEGDRRDARSEISCLVGFAFFCLTGRNPVDLVDANGNAPHAREATALQERIPEESQRLILNSYFARGFDPKIDNRFQTIHEMLERLDMVSSSDSVSSIPDPIQFIKESSARLAKTDRSTQLVTFGESTRIVLAAIGNRLQDLLRNTKSTHFTMQMIGWNTEAGRPDVGDILKSSAFALGIRTREDILPRGAVYLVSSVGPECMLSRATFRKHSQQELYQSLSEWTTVAVWPGLEVKPETNSAVRDLDTIATDLIRRLEEDAKLK